MKEYLITSINNVCKLFSANNITEDQRTLLMEILGTLQAFLILETEKAA